MTTYAGTVTLTDFLLERIAEDEANANIDLDGERDLALHPSYGAAAERVLAECEAKRRIVELRYSWNLQAERMGKPPFGPILQTQVNTADAILRALAAVYADHESFQEEWRV